MPCSFCSKLSHPIPFPSLLYCNHICMVRVTDCYCFLIIYTLWWDSLSLFHFLSLSLSTNKRVYSLVSSFSNATFSTQQNNTTSFEFASNHFFKRTIQLIHPPSSSIPSTSLSFLLRIKQGMYSLILLFNLHFYSFLHAFSLI